MAVFDAFSAIGRPMSFAGKSTKLNVKPIDVGSPDRADDSLAKLKTILCVTNDITSATNCTLQLIDAHSGVLGQSEQFRESVSALLISEGYEVMAERFMDLTADIKSFYALLPVAAAYVRIEAVSSYEIDDDSIEFPDDHSNEPKEALSLPDDQPVMVDEAGEFFKRQAAKEKRIVALIIEAAKKLPF